METPKISYKRCLMVAFAIVGAALAFQAFLTSHANAAWRWGWQPQAGLFDTKKVDRSVPAKTKEVDDRLNVRKNHWAVVRDVIDSVEGTRAYVDHAIDLREYAITAELKRKFPAYMQGIASQIESKINAMDNNINTVLINSAAATDTVRILQGSVQALTDRVAELEKENDDLKGGSKTSDKNTALAVAMSNINFISVPGKFSAAAALGQSGKQFAGALGFAYTFESGNAMFSVQAGMVKTKFAVGAGASMAF